MGQLPDVIGSIRDHRKPLNTEAKFMTGTPISYSPSADGEYRPNVATSTSYAPDAGHKLRLGASM